MLALPLIWEDAMHALIIEDETLIAMAVEDALRDCGVTSVDFACSVETAVEAAKARRPDLVTTDVRLAPGSGIEAVEAICAMEPVPVIFITGTPADVNERHPKAIIVQKPFRPPQIAAAVLLAMGSVSGAPRWAQSPPSRAPESGSSR